MLPAGVAERVRRNLTPLPERPLPHDPVAWARERLDEHLWSVQREIAQALTEHRRVAVASAHGIGKSYIASRLTAWWIEAHRRHEARVVTTAPSGPQVTGILWRELQQAHTRGALPGHITRGSIPEWVIDGEQVAVGRHPKQFVDEQQAIAAFQGLHAPYLLGVLDEGGGIPLFLWTAFAALMTNEACRLLAIGNPTDEATEFARICRPGSGWHVIHVSAFDTPAYTGERVPQAVMDALVSRLWVDERREEWGEDSPLWKARVLGQFTEESSDAIISPRLVREAQERDLSGKALGAGRYGMDVADLGESETAIYLDRGGYVRLVDAWRGVDTDKGRERAEAILDSRSGHWQMQIDFPGVGGAVFHPLRRKGYRVVPFNGGEPAADATRFVNRNAEAWWGLREDMRAGLIDIDPADEVLAAQLQNRKWRLDSSQRRIEIEKKQGEGFSLARRGIKSPDRADAMILSRYRGARTVEDVDQFMRGTKPTNGESTIAGDLMRLRS